MKSGLLSVPIVLSLMCAAGACSRPDAPPASAAEAIQRVAEAATAATADAKPVLAAELFKRFPERVEGLPRVGNKRLDNPGGMGMSVASATYREGRRRVEITITDAAGVGRMAGLGAGWALADYDRTTASGYERTIRIDGFKAMESQERSGGVLHSEVAVLAGDRFLVRLKATEIAVDALKRTLDALDLRGLAGSN